MKKNRVLSTFLLVVIIAAVFFAFIVGFDWISTQIEWFPLKENQSDVFRYGEMIVALIAAFLVVEQLRSAAVSGEEGTKIQESLFVQRFNEAFIKDPEMFHVESILESYYSAYMGWKEAEQEVQGSIMGENIDDCKIRREKAIQLAEYKEKIRYTKDMMIKEFGTSGTAERQSLINYLVYLEGLATVINNGSIRLETVDSLMGYRFFLAVNNPVVQELELRPYGIHYEGIYLLYSRWCKYRENNYHKMLESGKIAQETLSVYGPDNPYGMYGVPMQNEKNALLQNCSENYNSVIMKSSALKLIKKNEIVNPGDIKWTD